MNKFSLSRARGKVLPEHVEVAGERINVDADFRTVLRCLRMLDDDDIPDERKHFLLMWWFFKRRFVQNGFEVFFDFISTDETPDGEPATMDFEQDADAIYASFLQQYGIDLIDVHDLHWYKFMALLGGLGEETALNRRISLRNLDTSKMKGKEKMRADKAKRRVALKQKMSAEEAELQHQLDEALAGGSDPTDALAALRAYYER